MQDKNRIHLADIEDEPENVLTINESTNGVQCAPRKKLVTKMNVNGHTSVVFQIDTGATCNILRADDTPSSVEVDRSERPSLCFFNDSKTTALGICNVSLSHESNPHSIHTAKFVVVDKGAASLLGAQSSVKMDWIEVKVEAVFRTQDNPIRNYSPKASDYANIYPSVFADSIGCFLGKLKLNVLTDARPTSMTTRRIPVALKEPVKQELQWLEQKGLITPVDEPTDWISAMAVVHKPNGDFCIWIDPHELNKALMESPHPVL